MNATLLLAPAERLGLSPAARQQSDVLRRADTLLSDEAVYEVVRARLAVAGALTAAEIERAEREFLQYALLCALTGAELSPSPLADAFWHEFLLDTRLYAAWCGRQLGRFLHHQPEPLDSLEDRGVLERSRRLYHAHFVAPADGLMETCFGTNCGNTV